MISVFLRFNLCYPVVPSSSFLLSVLAFYNLLPFRLSLFLILTPLFSILIFPRAGVDLEICKVSELPETFLTFPRIQFSKLIFRSGVLGPGDPPHILLSYDPVVDPGPTLKKYNICFFHLQYIFNNFLHPYVLCMFM
jgi:hypothetical protein